jgi:hypothetical protein
VVVVIAIVGTLMGIVLRRNYAAQAALSSTQAT